MMMLESLKLALIGVILESEMTRNLKQMLGINKMEFS